MTIEQMTRDAVEEAKRPDAGAGTARWRNRIVWAATAAPRDLAADRSNWRVHPRHQPPCPGGLARHGSDVVDHGDGPHRIAVGGCEHEAARCVAARTRTRQTRHVVDVAADPIDRHLETADMNTAAPQRLLRARSAGQCTGRGTDPDPPPSEYPQIAPPSTGRTNAATVENTAQERPIGTRTRSTRQE